MNWRLAVKVAVILTVIILISSQVSFSGQLFREVLRHNYGFQLKQRGQINVAN